MLSYILRRLLLMIPTLFGITVMVFLIARFAPGRPGPSAFGEGGQMDAQGQKELREWYERRYGLDLPMHEQYVRWWRGMFFKDTGAWAWSEDMNPIFTPRIPPDEYFTVDGAGNWSLLKNVVLEQTVFRQDDEAFQSRLTAAGRETLVPIDDDYPTPRHVFLTAEEVPLDDPLDPARLRNAVYAQTVTVTASAWTNDGLPIYRLNGAATDESPQLLFSRAGKWFALQPSTAPERWQGYAQDDPGFRAKLDWWDYRNLPPIVETLPKPYHVIVPGEPRLLDEVFDAPALARFRTPTNGAVDARLWTVDGRPVFEAKKAVAAKYFMDDSGQWRRLIGETFLDEPTHRLYRQNDPDFLDLLDEVARAEFAPTVEGDDAPWQVILTGRSLAVDDAPQERDRRRYSHTLSLFDPTLGSSATTHTAVIDEIKRRLPVTLGINLIAFPIIYIVAIPTGILMALKRGKYFDTLCNMLLLGLWSIPIVLTGTMAIGYLAQGGKGLELFPTGNLTSTDYDRLAYEKRGVEEAFQRFLDLASTGLWVLGAIMLLAGFLFLLNIRPGARRTGKAVLLLFFGSLLTLSWWLFVRDDAPVEAPGMTLAQTVDRAWHLALPVMCFVYGGFAYLAKQMRASMLENFTMDYVRTARAKGVSRPRIVVSHVLRNSLLPLITIFATILPALITGSVVIETIFNIEGMGLFTFRAVQNRDYEVIQTMALIAGALNLTGLLVADICYALADPRITYR